MFTSLRYAPARVAVCSWGIRAPGLVVLLFAGWPGAPARAESVTCRSCDFDRDGDVDQEDFGLFQVCVAGRNVSQNNPACAFALLDADNDVDNDDVQFFASCVSGPGLPIRPGRLLITEFMASNSATIVDPDDPGLNEHPDWIELYNDDSQPVELGGLYLSNDLGTPAKWPIPAGISIGGGQRLLFWADNETNEGPRHTNFKLSKEGQAVVITAADGQTIIDSVTFGLQDTDVSLGRLPDISDHWRSFQAPDAPPTPGEANSAALNAPKVVINELMYHPYAAELQPEPVALEFIELYNASSFAASLTGWWFSEGVDFNFPEGTTLGAGAYLVIAADVAAFQAAHPGVANVIGGWTKKLSNDGEVVEITNAAGRVIDHVEYADQGDWAVRQRGALDHGHYGWEWYTACDGGGASLELMNPALPNEYGHNWASSTAAGGTPGAVNSAASMDIAPIIGNVTQTPTIPHSTQTVQLTAQVIDEQKTGLVVKAYYRRDGTTPFTAVSMADDGAHGDGPAGDGVYGCALPAQPNGTIVEYYFEAADAGGHVRHQPAFALPTNTPLTNRLYRVDNTFDPAAWQAGQQPVYYVIMTAAERTELADIGDANTDGIDEQESNAQMNATFVSLDEEGVKDRFNVGVRNRGKGSRSDPPMNYRINFVREHSWNGVSAIDINSKFPWLQYLGGQLFLAAGIQTANTRPLQIRVNGQNLAETGRRMFGSYTYLEPFDGDFTKSHFPDDGDGNIYTCRGWITQAGKTWFGELDYRGTDPTPYRINYSKDTKSAAEDWSDLIHLTDVLSNAPDATYAQQVATVVNVDQWVRWFALEALIGNNETNIGNGVGDDYSIYRGEQDTRFVLLPHDLDTIFGTGYGTGATTTDSIWLAAGLTNVKRFLQNPAFCHLYYRQLRELIQTVLSAEQLNPMVDNLLGGFVPQNERDAIKTFAAARNAYVLAQIPAALTIASDLPLSGGLHRTTQNHAALRGNANAYDTRSVMVSGLPAAWDPVAGTWSIGASGGPTQNTTLIAHGATWRYLDTGISQDVTQWKAVDFPDGNWKSGQTNLGYGDDGETQPQLSYGANPNLKYWTYYFRHTLDLGDLSGYTNLRLRLVRDDGAVVYINGQKAPLLQTVDNMPDNVTYSTPASSTVSDADERTFFEQDLSLGLLTPNVTNVVAVEVHQVLQNSSDLGFDLELIAEGGEPVVTGGVPLTPGVNHLVVQCFDGPDGTGNLVESGAIDVWYDNGSMSTLSGTIATSRTLAAASGPWHVTGDVTVAAGATLTIEPGAYLFFDTGAGLIVSGRLAAQGSADRHIHFARTPSAAANWDGVAFNNTLQENVMSWLDMANGDAQGHSIGVISSRLLIDHVTWTGTNITLIEVDHPSVIVQNSTFPSISGAELVHGEWLTGAEYFIVQGNVFGSTTGYNDVIDFSGCKRPGPILQVLDNVFEGGGDDGVDMDGTDAHVEGNVFMHFHHDNTSDSTSNGVSTGLWSGSGQTSDITVVRNVFFDVDHAMLLKENCHARFENNTIVNCVIAAINLGEPERGVTYGLGVDMDGDIVRGVPLTLQNVQPGMVITINRCDVPAAVHSYGQGNIDADPLFASVSDFHLQPGSPAIGKGPNGLDMGAYVPAGASISGTPPPATSATTAVLTVAGPGLIQYKYRLRDNGVWGGWSAAWAMAVPLELTGLQDGHSYAVQAIGQNSAGVWQAESTAVTSAAWTVDLTP